MPIYTLANDTGDKMAENPLKLLAKDIVKYTQAATAAHIDNPQIEQTVFGYLQQMEISIKGAMKLREVQVRDYMDRMDGG